MKNADFARWIQSFFVDWMGTQRNMSPNTIASYRDAWCLYLSWLTANSGREISRLELADINANDVLKYLKEIESKGRSIGTRNCRLSAIKSFAEFVLEREPKVAAQYSEIMRIPTKRHHQREMSYLDKKEFDAIVGVIDRSSVVGERDYTLLWFLLNTGCRIQEALTVTPAALKLKSPGQVRLIGKGRKERVTPLWPKTARLLEALLDTHKPKESDPIFANRYRQPLGAAGVRYKLAGYVKAASASVPSLVGKRVTPHTFRHTAGVTLVQAKVDVTVIQSLLGHVSLDTTNHYARANLVTKREALEHFDPSLRPRGPARWKDRPDVLNWLQSL